MNNNKIPTVTVILSTADLDRMASEDGYFGFGYIGGRQHLLPESRAAMDAVVLDRAAQLGLTYEELFAWANSKTGRWYADCSDSPKMAAQYLPSKASTAPSALQALEAEVGEAQREYELAKARYEVASSALVAARRQASLEDFQRAQLDSFR